MEEQESAHEGISIRFRQERPGLLVVRASGLLTREALRVMRRAINEEVVATSATVVILDLRWAVSLTCGDACQRAVADEAAAAAAAAPPFMLIHVVSPVLYEAARIHCAEMAARGQRRRVVMTSLDAAVSWASVQLAFEDGADAADHRPDRLVEAP